MQTFTEEQKQVRRERARTWNMAHKDRVKQNQRLARSRNIKAIRERQREYSSSHRRENAKAQAAFIERNPWHNSLYAARARCVNKHHPRYKTCGGRGIEFHLTRADMTFMWARDRASEMLEPSIDRRDNDGHYALENCSFTERRDNARKRAFDNWRRRHVAELKRVSSTNRTGVRVHRSAADFLVEPPNARKR